jgi:hypothetical protein
MVPLGSIPVVISKANIFRSSFGHMMFLDQYWKDERIVSLEVSLMPYATFTAFDFGQTHIDTQCLVQKLWHTTLKLAPSRQKVTKLQHVATFESTSAAHFWSISHDFPQGFTRTDGTAHGFLQHALCKIC